jgi:ankyrin repeat protein
VRYFCHEVDGGGSHGATVAPDFFRFVSGWTALGCAGSEWGSWQPFLQDGTFDPHGEHAHQWLDWLAQDPDNAPPGSQPRRVVARTEADRALLLAAQAANLAGVRAALAQGAQPDAEDMESLLAPHMFEGSSKGETALVLAARQNDLEMLQALLDAGASLGPHTLALPSLLIQAGSPGHTSAQTLRWLIERGARIDPWPHDRFNALHRLLDNRALPLEDFRMLLGAMLDAGCDPDVFQDRESGAARTTALMRAGPRTQQRLLDAGANPHLRDLKGRTAMHHAVRAEQLPLLQAHGLDINDLSQPDDAGRAMRPLHHLLSRHWPHAPTNLVQAMLAHGADPALPDGQGHHAWWHCRHVECAAVLEGHLPFDPAMRDSHGRSVLHQRVCHPHGFEPHDHALATWWVQRDLDVNAQDADGNTALHHLAARYKGPHNDAGLKALLAQGARWDVANRQGQTPDQLLKPRYRKKWQSTMLGLRARLTKLLKPGRHSRGDGDGRP